MERPMRVLVTGGAGQVGRELIGGAPAGFDVRGASHSDLDIGDPGQVKTYLAEFEPQLIINAAAYTAVDKAESDKAQAYRVNAEGPTNLAQAAVRLKGVRLIHISTDFVFDGTSSSPYLPTANTAPLGVYGKSKLAGEQAVLSAMGLSGVVMRTAWVYAAQGQNFLRTMLRLMNERDSVRVVADQIGTPTSAKSLADVLWRLASRPELSGIYHWTDVGIASWYDFAVAIAEEATNFGVLKRPVSVTPIATEEYPTPARRPAYSVLDARATYAALNVTPVHWRERLRSVIGELAVA